MNAKPIIYICGSFKNGERLVQLANFLETAFPVKVQLDWVGAGDQADKAYLAYSIFRLRDYKQALASDGAQNNFNFDKFYIDVADIVILSAHSGKSAHLEAGYALGKDKPTFLMFCQDEDPTPRFDLMYNFFPESSILYKDKDVEFDAFCTTIIQSALRKLVRKFSSPGYQTALMSLSRSTYKHLVQYIHPVLQELLTKKFEEQEGLYFFIHLLFQSYHLHHL